MKTKFLGGCISLGIMAVLVHKPPPEAVPPLTTNVEAFGVSVVAGTWIGVTLWLLIAGFIDYLKRDSTF